MDVAFGIEVEKAFRFGMQVHRQLHGQGQEREGREQEDEKRMFSISGQAASDSDT